MSLLRKIFLCELLGLDVKEGSHGQTQEKQVHSDEVKEEIEHIAPLEEITWRQKSMVLWLKEGDRNTILS